MDRDGDSDLDTASPRKAVSLVEESTFLSKLTGLFGTKKETAPPVWKEFPWEDIIIKTDVIKKWSKVDVRKIQELHTNFDPETAKF